MTDQATSSAATSPSVLAGDSAPHTVAPAATGAPAVPDAPVQNPPRATTGATGLRYTYRGEGTGVFQKCAWHAGRMISALLAMLLFRLHIRGQTLIPRSGGVLLVTNHQSFLDPWLIGIAPGRQVHYMARDTLYKGGFLHWLMELLNAFPVKRGTADLGAIRTAVERLDRGYLVNVFPEGTRSEDGTVGPIAPGVALILHRTKTPVHVIPVIIDGAFDAWPRNARFPRPASIRMAFGQSITPQEWRASSAEALAQRIRRELVALQEQVGSAHAAASRRRMMEDDAKSPADAGKGRKRVRTIRDARRPE